MMRKSMWPFAILLVWALGINITLAFTAPELALWRYLMLGSHALVLGGILYIHCCPYCRAGENSGWMQYYNNFTMPVVEFAHDGTIVNSNIAFQKSLLSTGVQSLYNIFDLIVPTRGEHKSLRDLQLHKEVTSVEVSINNLTGYVGILNIIQNTYDNKYLIGFLTDITEFKELETRFYHSQKMQAIGQLAGGIAHDFNNIMTTVLGVCDLLLMKHTPSDRSFVDIKQIQQNAIRAISLVKQLLAFSRKQILTPSKINVSRVLEELTNNLIRRLIGENIELELQLDRNQWCIKVDDSQFEQVIINLAVNARDAMPNGGTLTIKTRNVEIGDGDVQQLLKGKILSIDSEIVKNGAYVLIEVNDTGTGIKDSDVNQIFEPFFSTKPQHVGSGLGLSTVYGIVKQTGGQIYLSSEIGVGTTFYILFKSSGLASDADSTPVEKRIDDDVNVHDLTGTESIMVVEDEIHVRKLCSDALRNKGYTVLEAESCEEALEIFAVHKDAVELIITDIVMRGMSGSELAVAAIQMRPEIKIILISGYTEDTISHLLKSECRVLPKPFTLKQLATTVRQTLGNKDGECV